MAKNNVYSSGLKKTHFIRMAISTLAMAVAASSYAASSAKDLARLGLEGTELTPAGAIRAGNAEGTIPAWKNVPIKVPSKFKPGTFHLDPFASDKVKFTISSGNYQRHADKLTDGQIKMFETYPEYFMNVYQTRRSAVFKPYIYEAALQNAKKAESYKTKDGRLGFNNAVIAWAFPIPKNGDEALLNQVTRPQQPWVDSWDNTAAVTGSGDYVLSEISVQQHWKWSEPGNTIKNFDPSVDQMFYFQTVKAPAKSAGQVIVANDPVHFIEKFRSAWVYNPGQRRVKRAPQIVHDSPLTESDGLATTDQKFGLNGPKDRFNYRLLGKREIYIPYNSYKVNSGDLKYEDVISSNGRLNQSHIRYELHRVWMIEASLREGYRHDYSKRVFYLDEDSWSIALMDGYDRNNDLWRLQEIHSLMWYDVGFLGSTLDVQYDLSANRMLALYVDNEMDAPDFSVRLKKRYFTPASIRRRGVR
jgi:hypothetical protein